MPSRFSLDGKDVTADPMSSCRRIFYAVLEEIGRGSVHGVDRDHDQLLYGAFHAG